MNRPTAHEVGQEGVRFNRGLHDSPYLLTQGVIAEPAQIQAGPQGGLHQPIQDPMIEVTEVQGFEPELEARPQFQNIVQSAYRDRRQTWSDGGRSNQGVAHQGGGHIRLQDRLVAIAQGLADPFPQGLQDRFAADFLEQGGVQDVGPGLGTGGLPGRCGSSPLLYPRQARIHPLFSQAVEKCRRSSTKGDRVTVPPRHRSWNSSRTEIPMHGSRRYKPGTVEPPGRHTSLRPGTVPLVSA